MLNIVAGLLNGAGAPASTNSYESISTVTVGAGGVSSISFSSIPSTYKHLQIRAIANASVQSRLRMQFNSDTGNNYAVHYLQGSGSAASAVGAANYNQFGLALTNADANIFTASVVDILDYANTSKYKTGRILSGYDKNGSGEMDFQSGVWMNTAAVSTITMYFDSSATTTQYSHFALYGIKG